MAKSNKRFERHIFDDEKDVNDKKAGHRHSKLHKYSDDDEDLDFDDDFEYAEEVKHLLKK